ncbi:hypothetical protein OYE22_10510 [Streptomyces sp. 71268]|uniref:hypothetical protein n=1 Tax=Streptomyces sp. 71268 TaxID=3002640 RepID=UPI0023F702AC|nr:hypothetical protein [Streptomyces sp. 71268]WEV25572.1 hypothetical protein OYE22_10510 [Streptomyces sp. 71268]
MEHKMTLRVYQARVGEESAPDGPPSVVTVDSDAVFREDFAYAATAAWPPCRCPLHRAEAALHRVGTAPQRAQAASRAPEATP